MRIEIVVVGAFLALASAAPQWPYRDAVAPYYYGYPGKTPYMYRAANEEDDERDETYLARQDLKVGTQGDGGSRVTVIEDDEKADGIRVVETGSAKPVGQSASNNQQQQPAQEQQPAIQQPSQQQGVQPLSANANNNGQQQQQQSGQPLTVQQPGAAAGQQPPAFPPARPPQRRPAKEDEDEEEEDESEEEDDEDAEDDEDGDDSDSDEDEEEDDDRRRNDAEVVNKDVSEEVPVKAVQEKEPVAQVVQNESTSDEEVVAPEAPEEEVVVKAVKPVVVKTPSQSSVVQTKLNKNKQGSHHVVVPQKPKRKQVQAAQVQVAKKNPSGAIEALVPGYVTDQGEVLVPVDTVTGSQPITIVPDPFSPPSRIVSGPRPIPQRSVPRTPSRQVPYWYRNSPAFESQPEVSPHGKQTLYSAVPPPGSIFTFDDDDEDVDDSKLRQDGDDDDAASDEDEEDEQPKSTPKPVKVPLAAISATQASGEDDEIEQLNLIKPASSYSPIRRKKPAPGGAKAVDESEEEGSEEEDEEDEEDEEEEDNDDGRRRNAAVIQLQQPTGRGRMNYVDEDYVSFPPSRSPTLLAVVQGKFTGGGPYGRPGPVYSSGGDSQIYSSPSGNPYQRYVVRVTPARRPQSGGSYYQSQPPTTQPLYYRPPGDRPSAPPRRKVVPVASFDVSVEDTRPDSDEEGDSVYAGPRPTPVVSSPPFIYKVQGQLQSFGGPGSGGPGGSRPSLAYYQATYGIGGGPGPRPGGYPGPYGGGSGGPGPSFSYRPRPRPSQGPGYSQGPPSASGFNPYAFLQQAFGPPPSGGGGGRPRPRPGGSSSRPGGPPVIIRRKPSGPNSRPPKPQLIAVYNPTGNRESPVDEEYYTYETPEVDGKITSSGGPNKRPTVHRKPTPVIKQKFVSEEEESSEEQLVPGSGGPPSGPVNLFLTEPCEPCADEEESSCQNQKRTPRRLRLLKNHLKLLKRSPTRWDF
ncbi:hypothetical protein Ocin01_15390 [Orchesella cincta]|uniref:Uncharacterized protein n=1 Tax=Orchesella cincta TaxID=48709 RepID=A0A1D2MED4_ORCCI|nr:hypothetical protein Ocin01_15390 [Orchesella cincta]